MLKNREYLRLYTGDTRIRQSSGRLSIDESTDAIWGDKKIYRTINMLLFSGLENERARIREGQVFNYKLMDNPEILLQIMIGITEEILSQPVSERELTVFRMDRAASMKAFQKGYISSFFSCKKGNYDPKFAEKEGTIALEVHIPQGTHYADLEKVLGKEYVMDEAEILLPPYQCISLSRLKQKNLYATEVYCVDVLVDKSWESSMLLENEKWSWSKAYSILFSEEKRNKALKGLARLTVVSEDEEEVQCYLEWKRALQICFITELKNRICQ